MWYPDSKPLRWWERPLPQVILTFFAGFLLGIALLLAAQSAYAKTSGERMRGPDESEYFASLMMPNSPRVSCCGEADVYWADGVEEGPNGSIVAVITDDRPDDRVLPDGREIHRAHIPVGTHVVVPPDKLRKHPIANPTGHTIIFLGGSVEYLTVYCYEPQALL